MFKEDLSKEDVRGGCSRGIIEERFHGKAREVVSGMQMCNGQ